MSDALALLRESTPVVLYSFAEAFLQCLDVREAARQVGHLGRGEEFLADRRTWAVIRALQKDMSEAARGVRETAIRELVQLLTWDPADAMTPDGRVKDLHELPLNLRKAAHVVINDAGRVKLTFDPRVRFEALRQILQMTGDMPTEGAQETRIVFRGREDKAM
jgi:hypothetical protein